MPASALSPSLGLANRGHSEIFQGRDELASLESVYRRRRAMLEEIKADLTSDAAFFRYRELRLELGAILDEWSRRRPTAYLSRLVPFIEQLPVPRIIKQGIRSEYRESLGEMTSRSFGQREVGGREPPSVNLFTGFRTRPGVARLIAKLFCAARPERFASKGLSSALPFDIDAPEGGSLIPYFRVNCNGLSTLLAHDERVLSKFYQDSLHLLEVASCGFTKFGQLAGRDGNHAMRVLRELSGEVPELRAAVLARFGGRFPLMAAPEVWTRADGRWIVREETFGFTVPWGALPHTREHLETYQRRIELGVIGGCSLTVRGRIDRAFLDWLSGGHHDRQDPLPDLEIVYAVPLASGREYPLLLKAARGYSLRPSHDVSAYPEEDQRIIYGLGRHFLLADNKRTMRLLTEFRVEDYPDTLQAALNAPLEISDFATYKILRERWDQSIRRQLTESAVTFDKVRCHHDGEEVLRDPATFTAHCSSRVRALPCEQDFHPPDYFTLTEDQHRRFVSEYVPSIFELRKSETGIVANEPPDLDDERRALGYRGPRSGYLLPLDHHLLDMIIDLRKRDRYRSQHAMPGENSEVGDVPPSAGRPYHCPERIFPVTALPLVLSRLEADPRYKREIHLRVFDPLEPESYKLLPIDRAKGLRGFLWEENRRRLNEYFKLSEAGFRNKAETGKTLPSQRTLVQVFMSIWEQINAAADECLREEKDLAASRKGELARLHAELLHANSAEREARLAQRSAELEAARAAAERKLHQHYDKLEFLGENFFPTVLNAFCLRGNSIIDRRVVSFIYSIGRDGIPILSEELPSRKGAQRITHSQQLGGRAMFAGGELLLAQHDRIFHSLSAWRRFDETLRTLEGPHPWSAIELNNSTGHYLVLSDTLPYASNILFPLLEAAGIRTESCQLIDRLAPGLRVRGAGMYRF